MGKNKKKRTRKRGQQNISDSFGKPADEKMDIAPPPTSASASSSSSAPKHSLKASKTGNKANATSLSEQLDEEELEFEDPYGDDVEPELILNPDAAVDLPSNVLQASQQALEDDQKALHAQKVRPRVWRPGVDELAADEQLDYDPKAYTTFHRMHVEWPSLSFDILRDGLGVFRTKFPATMYLAAGSQADRPNKNKVTLMKISDIHKTKHDVEDSDSDDDDDTSALDVDPTLVDRSFKHMGDVNRLRCMGQRPHILATWSGLGTVQIYDTAPLLSALDKPPTSALPKIEPAKVFEDHKTEGFALAWSPVTTGRLLSGDCASMIHVWEPTQSSWEVSEQYTGHADSVEDVEWSPIEPHVFASCSVDKTVRIWDCRKRNGSMLFVAAHQTDVNVISWNRKSQHLLVSGSDDGSFKIWDLRNFKSNSPVAHFKWHAGPITSIEWQHHEESVLAVASADNSISVWDLALEEDPDAQAVGADLDFQVPPQLVFVHQGQRNIKELHFHPHIPAMLVSTAEDGFNVFKPANMEVSK